MTQAHLVLADGTTYTGTAFGASGTTVGEVVFNTGMTGYQEILTDPSYAGQLVALTYPIIGNYGVTPDDFESRQVQVAGFIVKELADAPSNWRSQETLDSFFGSPDWREHAYGEADGLFGAQTSKLDDSGIRLLEWYRGRLKEVFGHVSPGRLIRNTQGGHLYYLVWAGPHKKGLDGANHILSKGDRIPPAKRRAG